MIVVWRVNTHCNMSCGFCAYDRNLRISRTGVPAEIVRHFAKVLAQYQEATQDEVLLSFLGGEPFLWQPLDAVSRFAKNQCALRISATTNGSSLMNARTQRLIAEEFDEITISLDGLAEFHDSVRGVAGTFERIRIGIQQIRSIPRSRLAPLKVRLNTVLMHDNVEQFAALCAEVSGWPIDELTFNQLGGNDRPAFHERHKLTSEDVAHLSEVIPSLRTQLGERGVRLLGSEHYLRRMAASASGAHINIRDCRPARAFLFIDEHGSVAPCSFTAASHGVNVREITSYETIVALNERYATALRTRRPASCDDCPSTQVFDKYAA
jgi:MoaA/NifB/PqqE/SkfB family radical SAM enzyme